MSDTSMETALATTLLAPHSDQLEVAVVFSPKIDQELNMLLLLRNNLTVIDYVMVQGSGVQGAFAIDGVQPSTQPLLFEFPNTVAENCLGEFECYFYQHVHTPSHHPTTVYQSSLHTHTHTHTYSWYCGLIGQSSPTKQNVQDA